MPTSYKRADLFHLPSTNPKIEKFINFIMKDGKKTIARKLFAETLAEIKASGHENALLVWETAIENASPNVMVKSKRVWGANYAIPMDVRWEKRFFYSCKWILDASRAKKGSFVKKLTKELLEAYTGQGTAVKKREEAHKMAEANKANAHLAKYL